MAKLETVEVVGPGGRIKVNARDLAKYEGMGYKRVPAGKSAKKESGEPAPGAAGSGEGSPDGNPEDEFDARSAHLNSLKVAELKEIAQGLEIEGYSSMTKEPLIEAILGAEFEDEEE